MTSQARRRLAEAALDAVHAGTPARDAETEIVDFKEESGTRGRGGQRQAIAAHHEPAAVALAAEVACLANGDQGGVLVVGVDDRAGGPAAFVGAHLDPDWLRGRIYALTQPNHTVQIERVRRDGVDLLLIDVPPALELIRAGGRLRSRIGRACEEMPPDRAAALLERRRGYDWSAQPSGWHFRQVDPAAMRAARRLYTAARGLAPDSDLELCRRMSVLVGPGLAGPGEDHQDPELNHAGALLLCPSRPHAELLVVLAAPADGVPSSRSVRGMAPLLPLFDEAWELVTEHAFPSVATVIGPSRRMVRAIPDAALREALVNGLMHRDYRLENRAVVAHAIGREVFRVRSPGGFVLGVRADRLITSPSIARNFTLAEAFRVLGLAEREGVGVDTMYAQMLRSGHAAPEIVEEAGDVCVTLRGGAPDADLMTFFEELTTRDPALDGVRSAMAITTLLVRTPLRADSLAELAQCTVEEAQDTLARLEQVGVVDRLVNRSRAFRLSSRARGRFLHRIQYPGRRKAEEHLDLIQAFLDGAHEISRDDAATLLGVAGPSASRILSDLAREGRLVPVAHRRGPGVRYRMPD